MAGWMILEVYRENGAVFRELIESGLTESEAKETASEFNENMEVMGITGHWIEARPDPAADES